MPVYDVSIILLPVAGSVEGASNSIYGDFHANTG